MIKQIINLFIGIAFFFALAIKNVDACAVCYGAVGSPFTQGLNMAILTLLMILVGVLGCVGAFLLQLRKRSKENNPLLINAMCKFPSS